MGVNSLPKTVTWQRRGCDLNPGPTVPYSSTLTTRLPSICYEWKCCRTGGGEINLSWLCCMLKHLVIMLIARGLAPLYLARHCEATSGLVIHCCSAPTQRDSFRQSSSRAFIANVCRSARWRRGRLHPLLLKRWFSIWLIIYLVLQCSWRHSAFSALTLSVLWRCWLGDRKGIRPVKNWVVRCWHGYLSGARCRLAQAQLMPLPLTVSCFSKIQIGFTFLVPAHPGSPGKRAIKRVCVCAVD